MASTDAEAGAGCCGIILFSALEPWCNTKTYGASDGNRLAGCCGSCCNKSFNEDSTDTWAKPSSQPETTQPQPSKTMSIPAPSQTADPIPPTAAAPTTDDSKS
ncbi:hypothetical protein B0H16DRAFT_1574735 [Mycena metata]|uniref:Uncharacterized protein n=1 Tax=Mycena metata TaxID=1033252 RepID=A0AAD7I761_9AGAR|nr:hypothetical protein B0H16DRAFT_1574735 [Mycena metata]